ncbi:MAG: glycosyltransferase 36 [Myxococcales bacterium]|nr:glycosyltransferase 36 [Myxococcales bacterium]
MRENTDSLISKDDNTGEVILSSPTAMPRASAFLWNPKMMIQVNCRGYAVAQHMQPEPAKYAYAPNIEGKTFMQPEQPYYAHHPGRFFYVKDEETNEILSVPYEPCRYPVSSFKFCVSPAAIEWKVQCWGLYIHLRLVLASDQPIEVWELRIKNIGQKEKKISIYTYFPIGYMSWMNQSGRFDEKLNSIVASCISPYQKRSDYYIHREFKDLTYFLADKVPDAFDVRQESFEGEGGLHNPSGTRQKLLSNSHAMYETPAAVLQYRSSLFSTEEHIYRFLFGPAKDTNEIASIRETYFDRVDGYQRSEEMYSQYISGGDGALRISTPDKDLDHFVNHWLGRQIFYHGDVHRLTTDPQTRNYLQDTMGMSYVDPTAAREAFLYALSQQKDSGAMPEGILLEKEAELKYINRIPHMDHCVWLVVCLEVYLEETNDYALLDEVVVFDGGKSEATVAEHVHRAMQWLLSNRDHRGLSYIAEGDWCDPMNMVGYRGKGVSGWLSFATAYALKIWAKICESHGDAETSAVFGREAGECIEAANRHLWDGDWYARGITDDDIRFGTKQDVEGKIFLNPQAWAMLAGAASDEQCERLINSVEKYLESPYGVALLAPAFTKMREDIGRITQKYPGSAENGSVYNHAAAFYIYALYGRGDSQRAFTILRQMLPGPKEADYIQRGQLPVFIPNYYRGYYKEQPRTAGRSSQLCNTGTVHWAFRCLVNGLLGMRGTREGLNVEPHFPADWDEVRVERRFRGANFSVYFQRVDNREKVGITVNGQPQQGNCVSDILEGEHYMVEVKFL